MIAGGARHLCDVNRERILYVCMYVCMCMYNNCVCLPESLHTLVNTLACDVHIRGCFVFDAAIVITMRDFRKHDLNII